MIVAARGQACSMWCSTASTTDDGVVDHEADGQHQSKQRQVFRLKRGAGQTAKRATMATGTATSGITGGPPVLGRNKRTTKATRMTASRRVSEHLADTTRR